jgi:putative tryptophan/tyrosine transport system substrate-binding protein
MPRDKGSLRSTKGMPATPLRHRRSPHRVSERSDRNPAAQQSPAVPRCAIPVVRKHRRSWAVKRRDFITLLGVTAAWPLVARAQQPAKPVIGVLHSASQRQFVSHIAAFRRGLNEGGYIEGDNVTVEYRWADGRYDRLPELAAELVQRPVAVLVTLGGDPPALAAKATTSTIPIVFNIGGDPVRAGLVANFNRPGGNATGVNILSPALEGKRLGLLHDLVPQAKAVAVLLNPSFPPAAVQLSRIEEAAQANGLQLHVLRATTHQEVDAAFETITQQHARALLVASDPFFVSAAGKLAALAARHAVPAMYPFREYTVAGGLMSYGIDLADAYRQVGVYVGRILRGAKPADLPVVQPTKFELVINMKAARALGLAVPNSMQLLADEVIE